MTALFGNPASLGSSKYLVEFRAGKMNLKGKTVTPDKRKGTVYIHQSEDSLMHFCWKDRTSGNVEDVSYLYVVHSQSVQYRCCSVRHFCSIGCKPLYRTKLLN